MPIVSVGFSSVRLFSPQILDDRVVSRFRLEEQPRLDFVAASRRLHQRLQRFFDSKVHALRRLARAAEQAARTVDVDRVLGPTLGSETRCTAHMRAMNASEVQNEAEWKAAGGRRRTKSGVHVRRNGDRRGGVGHGQIE